MILTINITSEPVKDAIEESHCPSVINLIYSEAPDLPSSAHSLQEHAHASSLSLAARRLKSDLEHSRNNFEIQTSECSEY